MLFFFLRFLVIVVRGCRLELWQVCFRLGRVSLEWWDKVIDDLGFGVILFRGFLQKFLYGEQLCLIFFYLQLSLVEKLISKFVFQYRLEGVRGWVFKLVWVREGKLEVVLRMLWQVRSRQKWCGVFQVEVEGESREKGEVIVRDKGFQYFFFLMQLYQVLEKLISYQFLVIRFV